jgi:hypothetical protein
MIHIDVRALLRAVAMKAAIVEDAMIVVEDMMTVAEDTMKVVADESMIVEDAKMVIEEMIVHDATKKVREEEKINMPNEAIIPTMKMIKDANPEEDRDLPTKKTAIVIILPLETVIVPPDIVLPDIKAVKERRLEIKVGIEVTEIETEVTEEDASKASIFQLKGDVCISPKSIYCDE